MSVRTKKIAILASGVLNPADYESQARLYLDAAQSHNDTLGEILPNDAKKDGERYEIEVFKSSGELLAQLKERPEDFDQIICLSVEAIDDGLAATLAQDYPRILVVVMAGRKPKKSPFVVPKSLMWNHEFLERVLGLFEM